VAKIVAFQLPLSIPEKPDAGRYRRRLARAKNRADYRTLLEEVIRDYQAELDRLNARHVVARAHADLLDETTGLIKRVLHD
jgi:hypothetical protein